MLRSSLLLLVILSLTACSGLRAASNEGRREAEKGREPASQPQEVSFQDSLGHEIRVNHPQRVAVLMGSFADIWQSAGGKITATVQDSWSNPNLELQSDPIHLGDQHNPNIETLLAAKPDFVIASSRIEGQTALYESLQQAGIPIAFFEVNSFDQYLNTLRIFTQITGREDLYQKNGLQVQQQIQAVKERENGSHPTVLVLRVASAGNVKIMTSKDLVLGEILKDLGAVNIADSDQSLKGDFSMEAVLKADPNYIFVTTMGSDTQKAKEAVQRILTQDPSWQSLTAVREGRYHLMDKRLYQLKPNAHWGDAYEGIAEILFPRK